MVCLSLSPGILGWVSKLLCYPALQPLLPCQARFWGSLKSVPFSKWHPD